jgi:hypothetical protein
MTEENIWTQSNEIIECWRKLDKEVYKFYSSPNIIRMIKSRRMTWVVHVTRRGKKRNAYRFAVRKL